MVQKPFQQLSPDPGLFAAESQGEGRDGSRADREMAEKRLKGLPLNASHQALHFSRSFGGDLQTTRSRSPRRGSWESVNLG